MECGIPVTDLDAMLDFYCSVLGCKESRRADIPAQLSNQLAVAPDGYVNVWLETPGGEIIKLMQPRRLRNPTRRGSTWLLAGGLDT